MPMEVDAAPADDIGESAPRWEQAARCFVRWRDGDSRALDELVRIMTPVLWHTVRAYGLSTSAAEDVVQSTWLAFVRKHDSVQDAQAVSAWLTITARRNAWQSVRMASRSDATEDEILEVRLPAQPSAEDEAVESVAAQRLWRAVGELDDRCRRLLRVVAFDERPDYRRIADDLGMPMGSIGPTRGRCLAKLRGLIQGTGLDSGAE
ncbi:RNA polymerase sigma factor [Microbacterium sp. Marseille-Q6965]|uniref:RNA polymerase sigma factor n=1 Tax=Microbacterium sp. Marseille-Q6965 TaxID=2965072 RepID=UPI0021B81E31|nr:sigma-70 family RNA polymerase sigma factor [Microbacterium sp. Marseille-Q6965]